MDAVALAPETSLDGVVGIDVAGLSDRGLVEAMMAAGRLASRVQAVQLAAVAELARRRFAEDANGGSGENDAGGAVEVISARDYVHDEVAQALTLTSVSAEVLIRFSTELTGRLPDTFAALAAGEIDQVKARAIWLGLDQVEDELAGVIEAKVLARAAGQTSGEIRAKIRRLVKRLAPEALERRRVAAEQRRDVMLAETGEGTASLVGTDLPADAASAAYGRVTAIAAGLKRDGDERGIGRLRADVFLALLRGTLKTTEPPADPSQPSTTSTTGAAGGSAGDSVAGKEPAWTGVDDLVADVIAQTARAELGAFTRDLPGRHRELGPLIAHAGQCLTASLTGLRERWCTPTPRTRTGRDAGTRDAGTRDASTRDAGTRDAGARDAGARDAGTRDASAREGPGGRDGHGHPGYRPPDAMRRLLEHRDRRCCFPGCRRPVRHCDADHSIPFHRGGVTCPCNLAMLCRRHHRTKQSKTWRIEHIWPGVILWIGPTGHWRITAPADRE